MRLNLLARFGTFLPLALVLGGCAVPTANTTPIQPLAPQAAIPFRTIYVNVDASTPEDVTKEAGEIAAQLTERLQELNAVSQVVQTDRTEVDEGELLIHLNISDMRKVGGGKRFLLGIFAGSASVTSTVEFFDGKTDECIGTYEIIGKTPSNSGSTGTAMALTVQGVVDIVKETYHITSG